jgi:hypothetical protein
MEKGSSLSFPAHAAPAEAGFNQFFAPGLGDPAANREAGGPIQRRGHLPGVAAEGLQCGVRRRHGRRGQGGTVPLKDQHADARGHAVEGIALHRAPPPVLDGLRRTGDGAKEQVSRRGRILHLPLRTVRLPVRNGRSSN